jgi:hypothetical protein
MKQENENMLTKFVNNIAASRKWCTYWEINKWNKPAPVDYENDKDFWYNLDANFDIIYACWRVYNWTGNKVYINNPAFLNFYNKSLNDYIHTWKLEADSLLSRPKSLNVDASENKRFTHGYGLTSYVENVPGLVMSADLIAAIYQGNMSYSAILKTIGKINESKLYADRAEKYARHLDMKWWDHNANLYNTHNIDDGIFGKGEGETFCLWFDIIRDNKKLDNTVKNITSRQWNVENASYFPYLLYTNGYWNKAYDYILYCSSPATNRREYPEVSYGVIEGIVKGLMGVNPDAVNKRISTIHRTTTQQTSELKDLPVLGTTLAITHIGNSKTIMRNTGNKTITWRAMFNGNFHNGKANGKTIKINPGKDKQGSNISWFDIELKPGQKIEVTVSGK